MELSRLRQILNISGGEVVTQDGVSLSEDTDTIPAGAHDLIRSTPLGITSSFVSSSFVVLKLVAQMLMNITL